MSYGYEFTRRQKRYLPIKRLLDFILSLCAGIVLSPLMLVTAIRIRADSPGPVLFRQKRIGKDKETFEILKFRTMRIDTPQDIPTHMLADPEQYITKVGRKLRENSLDELPQVYQIITGKMSIIGPRPALWNQDDLVAERERYGANALRPGLTGWAQIHGRDELEIPVKAKLDGYYTQHISFALDLKCLFGTVRSVAKHEGVVEGGTGVLQGTAGSPYNRDTDGQQVPGAEMVIDEQQMHFSEMSIDEQQMHFSEMSIDEQQMHFSEMSIDEQQTHGSEMSIDEQQTHGPEMSTADQQDPAGQDSAANPAAHTAPGPILIITNHSYMLWQFRRELIAELAREHEVVLCMPFVGHEDDFRQMGLRCIETELERRGTNPVKDLGLMKTYRRILQKECPQLVITYSIKPNIYAGLACGKEGIPFCANVQGLGTAFQKKGIAAFVTMLYRRSFRHVKTVFFENQSNADEFKRRGIVTPDKIRVLHGAGVNLEHHSYAPYPDNDMMHFLYLGRIMKEKGMDELFVAAERLREEQMRPADPDAGGKSEDMKLKGRSGDIAGVPEDKQIQRRPDQEDLSADEPDFILDLVGFFEDEYKEQVEDLAVRGIVRFHGFQEDPRPYYAQADCVVLPSYHEGMSNVLLEAAAAGRPLIASDIPGCREAVEDGVTGLLVPARDEDGLYEAMRQMLRLPRAQREAMGKAGREKMCAEFDKGAVVRETIDALPL